MAADLHIHSAFSDGTEFPEEVVAQAGAAGLSTISLTDHDTLEGLPRAIAAGRKNKILVIPGVEFSTEASNCEIHILGYFIDSSNPELLKLLEKIQKNRKERIYRIVEKLRNLGVVVDPEKILKKAGNQSPGRPHVARVLLEAGLVSSFSEAFNKYIDFKSPAYVPHFKLDPRECIHLITRSGGIAVFAHPEVSNCDKLIPDFIAAGLRGIEAYYPSYQEETNKKYLGIARKYGLLVTGGSDYHGLNSGRAIKLGDFTIDDSLVDKLMSEAKKP